MPRERVSPSVPVFRALQRIVGAQSIEPERFARGSATPACSFGDRQAVLSRARHSSLLGFLLVYLKNRSLRNAVVSAHKIPRASPKAPKFTPRRFAEHAILQEISRASKRALFVSSITQHITTPRHRGCAIMLAANHILQGRYQIIEPIGRGGMGAVYKALDTRLRAIVALKEILVEGEGPRRAFEREAQLLAGLRHPALPKVSDHFMEGDGQFLVMEFIPGDDLGSLLSKREGPFALTEVLRWADTLLDALEYLHSHTPPIIHRDIKPQNMKLTDRGEIILLDFGLAKGAVSTATRSTSTASIFGYTPHYAPLEQIKGAGTDPRSDLYALAATIYHLLTGAPPPDALTRAAARINDEPDPLIPAHQLNPEVSSAVATVLLRAMSQRPDQRYPSAAALRGALRDAARGGAAATLLLDTATRINQGDGSTLVMVGETTEQQAARAATASGMTGTGAVTDTTQSKPGVAAPAPAARPRWLWPVVGIVAFALVAIGAFFALGGGGGTPEPTPPSTGGGAVVVADTQAPTMTLLPTAAPLSDDQLVATAILLQTSAAERRTAEVATARALINEIDGAQTQTAIAMMPTPTQLPATETIAPTDTAAPTSTPRPTNTRGPTNTPRPTNTPDPNAPTQGPTNTPPPAAAPTGAVIGIGGSGDLFRGAARRGTIDPALGEGGSCIQGRVTQANGSLFQNFYVQVDNRGATRAARHFYDTGNYRICGLGEGEWGVAVYAVNNQPTSGAEQSGHQVRVRLSGQPGEIFYVDFTARQDLVVPTVVPTPTPEPATPTPEPSPYDGVWRGTNAGTTTTGEYPPGRFEIEVRNGAIYRISVDGPSCPFETYPNFPNGIRINGNSFATSGSVFNPVTGGNANHTISVTGTFVSTSLANGSLSAQLDGVPCANATWSARK